MEFENNLVIMSAINSVLVRAEWTFFFFFYSICFRRFVNEVRVGNLFSLSLEMFKCAVNCVESTVPLGVVFRLPKLFKILKNLTNKTNKRHIAHQSGMLLMLIIPCILNKKGRMFCILSLITHQYMVSYVNCEWWRQRSVFGTIGAVKKRDVGI